MSATYRSPSEERARAYAGAEALGDDEDAWDDGALMDAYNEAVERYKRAHNLASGSGRTALSPSVGAGKKTPRAPANASRKIFAAKGDSAAPPPPPPPPRRNGSATDRPSPERREWRNPDPTPSTPKRRGRIGTLITRTSATRDTLRGQDTTATTIITPRSLRPSTTGTRIPTVITIITDLPITAVPLPNAAVPLPITAAPLPITTVPLPITTVRLPITTVHLPNIVGVRLPITGAPRPLLPIAGGPREPPPAAPIGTPSWTRTVRPPPLARARPHPPRILPRVRLHRVLMWANPRATRRRRR